ncbi:MAG: right-handed parallel beta-helix repeat-containing protein, partial [Candidatus Cloacimonetes bacterium]|nr:right-handed parallel beta-helix repeat-containing protein [Candidatus Cloacimonadota bacterium]
IIDGNQNGSVATFVNGETTDAILIGFSITNGYALEGGGIHCFNYSNPSILYNKIYNNTGTGIGGGINCFIANPIISNNIIDNNSGQGIYCSGSWSTIFHSMVIENNTISNNVSSYGSGISLNFSNPFILNNSIVNNYAEFNGGGINCYQDSDPFIINNDISNNSARISGGGLYCSASDPFVINNLFYDNYSIQSGGGITCFQNSNSLIVNNTLTNNISEYYGGAFYCSYFSNPIVINTILWGNFAYSSGNEVFIVTDDSDPTFTYCDIEGGINAFGLNINVVYNGIYENNIDSDPLFIGIGDHPYSLQNISPCIDAGTPDTTGLYLPEFDIAGNPRISHNRIDIGAYE